MGLANEMEQNASPKERSVDRCGARKWEQGRVYIS